MTISTQTYVVPDQLSITSHVIIESIPLSFSDKTELEIFDFIMYLDVGNYLKHVSRRITCKIKRLQRSPICSNVRAFRENIDLRLTTKWSHILSTISILTDDERQSMRLNASKHGIHESMFYNDYIQVRDYCKQLEKKYVVVMHGHEKEMKLFLQLNNYYKVEYRVS